MTIIIKLDEKRSLLINFKRDTKSKKIVIDICTIISTNYSLFKYLIELLDMNSINNDKYGYVTLRRKDRTTTSIQRIIMEFYSKYDKRLEGILSQSEIEVDHINNEKLDNRLENFQLLSHVDNMNKVNKKEYQVTISNEYILDLDYLIKQLPQYETDKRYCQIKSSKFKNIVNTGNIRQISDFVYLDFSSSTTPNQLQNSSSINVSIHTVLYKLKIFLTVKDDDLINKLIRLKEEYICSKIVRHNILLINRFRSKYHYLDEVLVNHKILDYDYNVECFSNIKELRSKVEEREVDFNYMFNNLGKSNKVLYDLFEMLLVNHQYSIKNDNVLSTFEINYDFNEKGKYSMFRIMYILGLLQRHKSKSRRSFISIPIYTEELMKEANRRAKKILDLNLKKVRYFIVAEEFGDEMAQQVYGERYGLLNSRYKKYSLKLKEAVIEFFKSDEQIRKLGYTTIEDIKEYLEGLKASKQIEIPIYKYIDRFIKDLVNYNTDTILAMREAGFEYRSMSKSIIDNIKKYQTRSGIDINITTGLSPKKKAIVLTKLTK